MWNNTKKSNIRIIRVSEGERKEYGVKILFEEATSLVVQWLRLWVEGTDLISGQGTKILCGASKKNFF